jgi:hypothetical protein
LFAKPKCKKIEMEGSGFNKISEASSILLERPPSMEEVKQTGGTVMIQKLPVLIVTPFPSIKRY